MDPDTSPVNEESSTVTPGPWELKSFDESQTVVCGPEYDGGKHELVAIVSVGYHRPHGAANGRLIAAAPLLLEASQAVKRAMDHDQDENYDGCDDDCERALTLWADADRLTTVALAAASPAPTSGDQRAEGQP